MTKNWGPHPWRPRPQARNLGLLPGAHQEIEKRQAVLVLTRSGKPGAPLDFLHAVPPKNIVPVIVTFEDSAARVTSITHWPVLASGVVIVLANVEPPEKPPPSTSLKDAVEALLCCYLEDADKGRRGPQRGNPVGPTHGLTIYLNTPYSDFMGDVPGGQDRATSALSRSLGAMVIISPPDSAHACGPCC